MVAPRTGNRNNLGWVISCFAVTAKTYVLTHLLLFSAGSTGNFKLVKRRSRSLNLKVKQHVHLVTAVWIIPSLFPQNDPYLLYVAWHMTLG